MQRIVVAIDPSASASEASDEAASWGGPGRRRARLRPRGRASGRYARPNGRARPSSSTTTTGPTGFVAETNMGGLDGRADGSHRRRERGLSRRACLPRQDRPGRAHLGALRAGAGASCRRLPDPRRSALHLTPARKARPTGSTPWSTPSRNSSSAARRPASSNSTAGEAEAVGSGAPDLAPSTVDDAGHGPGPAKTVRCRSRSATTVTTLSGAPVVVEPDGTALFHQRRQHPLPATRLVHRGGGRRWPMTSRSGRRRRLRIRLPQPRRKPPLRARRAVLRRTARRSRLRRARRRTAPEPGGVAAAGYRRRRGAPPQPPASLPPRAMPAIGRNDLRAKLEQTRGRYLAVKIAALDAYAATAVWNSVSETVSDPFRNFRSSPRRPARPMTPRSRRPPPRAIGREPRLRRPLQQIADVGTNNVLGSLARMPWRRSGAAPRMPSWRPAPLTSPGA